MCSAVQKRYSNATVENWNNIIKNSIMEGQKRTKTSRVVRKCRQYVLGIYKEIRTSIPKSGLNYKRKIVNSMVSQEVWKRRSRNTSRKFAYHKMIKLRNIKKDHSEIADEDVCKSCQNVNNSNPSWTVVCEKNTSLYKKPLLTLLENGFVKDTNYYVELDNDLNYTVSYIHNLELKVMDYVSLNSNFVTINAIHGSFLTLKQLHNFKEGDVHACVDIKGITVSRDKLLETTWSVYVPFLGDDSAYKLISVNAAQKAATIYNGDLLELNIIDNGLGISKKLWLLHAVPCKSILSSGIYIMKMWRNLVRSVDLQSIQLVTKNGCNARVVSDGYILGVPMKRTRLILVIPRLVTNAPYAISILCAYVYLLRHGYACVAIQKYLPLTKTNIFHIAR